MPTKPKKIFLIVGTRPEFIKLAPLYLKMKELDLKPYWVQTNQHKELIEDLKDFWDIYPDFEFNLENKDLSLAELSSKLLLESSLLFETEKPDLVIVQGDTLSAAEAARAAFYLKAKQNIEIAHVEAGIRTTNILSPFPEEFNRRTISEIADYHFCPSEISFKTLCKEKNINSADAGEANIYLTGNTGIDALLLVKKKIKAKLGSERDKYILITSHRKENLVNGMQIKLCEVIYKILKTFKEEQSLTRNPKFLVSLHSNPLAQKNFLDLNSKLNSENIEGLELINSCAYPEFIKLMSNSLFIITDSGGIQEEAPYLNKFALILREEIEREEVYLFEQAEKLINNSQEIEEMVLRRLKISKKSKAQEYEIQESSKFYGNGTSSELICNKFIP